MLLQEDILLVLRISLYLGFGWGLVGVVGHMVWAVPGSCSVLGWARRMFIRWWGVCFRGEGGLSTFI